MNGILRIFEFRAHHRRCDAVVQDVIDYGGGQALGLRLKGVCNRARNNNLSPCTLERIGDAEPNQQLVLNDQDAMS
jgi:hypothetical protein